MEIPAYYMRGGTSKGVFFLADDLPTDPGDRDGVLLRVIGSPDPHGRHSDGMGGATASTSQVVLVRSSQRPDCDVDCLFGAVAIGEPRIDWAGNSGDLLAAAGPFAIWRGFVPARDSVTPCASGSRTWARPALPACLAAMAIRSRMAILPRTACRLRRPGSCSTTSRRPVRHCLRAPPAPAA